MALQKTVEFNGIQVQDAYIKISEFSGSKTRITFKVATSASSGEPAFKKEAYTCTYDIDGENPIRQAYEFLKVQPEFAGATDV